MKKPVAKKSVAKKRTPRRDATGHLDPQYARELRARSREGQEEPEGRAFFKEPRNREELSERSGEEAVRAMTSGEDENELFADSDASDDGGPFVETTGREEYANGIDESNPPDATREPFPRV
ncbi:hypothetical protein LZC95_02905 [Pendulispora brunnea]|uniref:Uncharacterized protein n=1 Tax=Pendulispora brunnea TaxID=2905690 RepID=A0ABZ2KAT4_9BACT